MDFRPAGHHGRAPVAGQRRPEFRKADGSGTERLTDHMFAPPVYRQLTLDEQSRVFHSNLKDAGKI